MLHTEQPGILYSAKPWWLEEICKEIAKLSTEVITTHCNQLFLWDVNRVIQIFTWDDGSFDGPCMQFLRWWWWKTEPLPPNCVKKQVKATNFQNTNRKIYTFVIKNLERFRLKWQVKGRKTGRKEKANLQNLTFPCCLICLRLCADATYGKRVWGLSWNWYYLIVCRMVDLTYKCGPLYMYRYVICK